MTNNQTQTPEPTAAQPSRADYIVDAFESHVVEHGEALIEDFVPGDHPEREEVTLELVRVDLERRHRKGSKFSITDYVERFPQTFRDTNRLAKLVFDEYVLRCRDGEDVLAKEYATRYGVETSHWPTASQICISDADHHDLSSDDGFPLSGDRLLDFQILAEFGCGAFSRVYLAQEETLAKRLVVLKVSRYFWAESDLLAKLQHTNIVPIHSVHRIEGMQIVCMPFWGTCTLSDILREVKDSPEMRSRDWSDAALLSTVANHQKETVVTAIASTEQDPTGAFRNSSGQTENSEPATKATDYLDACLNFGSQIADGLAHAHQRGIVHKDLKPANVLIADDGRPMILDFNLATDNRDEKQHPVGGTLPYMSPEQLTSFGENVACQSPEVDIYAVGVMLFELLATQKPFPFRSGSLETALERMISDRRNVPSLRQHCPELPLGVCRIVEKCLAFETKNRYSSAARLRDDLFRQLSNQPLVHVSDPPLERIQKSYKRSPRAFWVSLTLMLAVIFGVASWASIVQSRRAARNEAKATFHRFERDVPWLSSSLSLFQIDEKERESTWTKAEQWISKFDGSASLLRHLTIEQQEALNLDLAELQYAMASAKLVDAAATTDKKSSIELLTEARGLATRAAARFDDPPAVLHLQRDDIARLLGEASVESPSPPRKEPSEALSSKIKPAWLARIHSIDLLRKRRATAAIELLEGGHILQKHYADWARLGNAYVLRGDFTRAIECFTACIAIRSDVPFGYFQRGLAHADTSQHERALSDFQRYVELRPDSCGGLAHYASALLKLQKPSNALIAIDRAIRLEPEAANLHLIAAEVHRALGNHELALEHVHRASVASEASGQDHLSRGMAQLRQGSFTSALELFCRAHHQDPLSLDPIKNIAYVLAEHLERTPEALEWIQLAVERQPESSELLSTQAVLLARSGRGQKARQRVREALQFSYDATTLLRAASVYALTNRHTRDISTAIEYTRQAVLLDPNWVVHLANDPDLAAIHQDKRFQAILAATRTLATQH